MMTATSYPDPTPRGQLDSDQVDQLLRAIKPNRVLQANGVSHLSQQDVKAHLSRVFGFGGWDMEVLSAETVFERPHVKRDGSESGGFDVCYRALVRLTIRNRRGELVAVIEDGSTATAQNQNLGGGHDLAYKSAISLSLKRAAAALGDQFGLSLYNRGQMTSLVKTTLVTGAAYSQRQAADVQAEVEEQVSLGDEPDESAPAPVDHPQTAAERRKPVSGRQGTRRKPADDEPADEPTEQEAPAEAEPVPAKKAPAKKAPAKKAPTPEPEPWGAPADEVKMPESDAPLPDPQRTIAAADKVLADKNASEGAHSAARSARARAEAQIARAAESPAEPSADPDEATAPEPPADEPEGAESDRPAVLEPDEPVDESTGEVVAADDYYGRIRVARTSEDLRAIWNDAKADLDGDVSKLDQALKNEILGKKSTLEEGA